MYDNHMGAYYAEGVKIANLITSLGVPAAIGAGIGALNSDDPMGKAKRYAKVGAGVGLSYAALNALAAAAMLQMRLR